MSLMSILFRIGTDNSQLQTGLSQARNQVNTFSSDAKRALVGAFAGGAVLAGMKSLFNEMDRVQKIARRFDESAESVQRIGHAAKLSGSDVETAAKALTRLSVDANRAASQGLATYEDRFNAIGISSRDFLNSDLEGKLKLLAQAHSAAGSDAGKHADLMELLGRGAVDLMPLLDQGKEGLEAMFENAPVLADRTVDAMARANDSIATMVQNLKVGAGNLVGFISDVAATAGGGKTAGDTLDHKSFRGLAEMKVDQESPDLRGRKRRDAIKSESMRMAAADRVRIETAAAEEAAAEELRIATEAAEARAAAEEAIAAASLEKAMEGERTREERAAEAQEKLLYDALSNEDKLASKKQELIDIENTATVSAADRVEVENNRLKTVAEITALEASLAADQASADAAHAKAAADLAEAQFRQLDDADKLIEKEKQLADLQRQRAHTTGTDLLNAEREILEVKGEILDIEERQTREAESRARAAQAERDAEQAAYRRSVDERASENLDRRGMTPRQIADDRRRESQMDRERRSVERRDVREAARADAAARGLSGTDAARAVAEAERKFNESGKGPDGRPIPPAGAEAGQAGRKAADGATAQATEATLKLIHGILDKRLPADTA